ncbi:hypothetical protein PRZ48_003165 [Zasmidium cellare]|uniref:Uncharacterized protein n=1 Tax=Zasmidium cellare TaxID=395010 RepID=A0ABR0EUA0_ZASCE|nr:hypothetical protein PRZ48_003165 [Zasmidium cellare]
MDFSPLNRLSAELRLLIYEFALCTSVPLILVLENVPHILEGSIFVRPTTPQPDLLALVRTCKQIRHEALPVFPMVNHFKICAGSAIGSANRHQVPLVAKKCLECHATWTPPVRNLEISMGDSGHHDYTQALEGRKALIEEIQKLFGLTGPPITMELDLSCGVTSEKRSLFCPIIRRFPPVPPIRIEFAHTSDLENRWAIERAVGYARDVAVERGYATRRYMDDLEGRRERAFMVLERLSQESIRRPINIVFEDMAHISEGSHIYRVEPNGLGLTQTCRQIRNEVLPVFFGGDSPKYKICLANAIGSAYCKNIKFIAQRCFELCTSVGQCVPQMKDVEVSMGHTAEGDGYDFLRLRRAFREQMGKLFGRRASPSITLELDLSDHGIPTPWGTPDTSTIIHGLPPVPPIRFELAYAKMKENREVIERAVSHAKGIAVEGGYASDSMYLKYLEKRRRRAIYALRRL